jgi:hypothetical protein
LRWDAATAATEAIARASEAPKRPASALDVVASRVAPPFQIGVAVFSSHSKPPSLAAYEPARVTVPHNSTSANCRRLTPRLPPFGFPVRHPAGTRQLSGRNRFLQDKKAAAHHFFKRCCPNTTRGLDDEDDAKRCKEAIIAEMQRLPQQLAPTCRTHL